MPTRPRRRCTRCSQPSTTTPCPNCEARRKAGVDRRRGTATARGYRTPGHQRFHTAVLRRDPFCRCPGCPSCTHTRCVRESAHADHHPETRRQLVARGADPNDPDHGRGLCGPCHSHWTAKLDGGFGNAPG